MFRITDTTAVIRNMPGARSPDILHAVVDSKKEYSRTSNGWISVRTADLKGLTADLVQSPPTLKHSESRGKILEQNSERL